MEKPLRGTPLLEEAALRDQIAAWKQGGVADGDRVVVEWSTGTGPHVFAYPAYQRASGTPLVRPAPGMTQDERWADFLEFTFVPKVIAALEKAHLRPQVICVDLRPLQVQRARRREIEAVARAKQEMTVATH